MAEAFECSPLAISQELCLEANVQLDPGAECGPLGITCLRSGVFPSSRGPLTRSGKAKKGACKFKVFQEMCVLVPVVFEATMDGQVGRCVVLNDTSLSE